MDEDEPVTTWVYVDETKRAGYVLAAVTVTDPIATRKAVRSLIVPGRRRVHMNHEHVRHRRIIVSTLTAMPLAVTLYDAARNYPTDLQARAACLTALVRDLAATDGDTHLVLEQDDSLLHTDRLRLFQLARATGQRDTLHYEHQRAHAEPLLALPDVAAWCWVRSGEWRRRISPVTDAVRSV